MKYYYVGCERGVRGAFRLKNSRGQAGQPETMEPKEEEEEEASISSKFH